MKLRFAILVLCCAWHPLVGAQLVAPAAAPVLPRWYQVEIVVFRYLSPIGVDGEQFPAPAPADYTGAQRLKFSYAAPAAAREVELPAAAAQPPMPVAYQALPPDDLALREVARRVRQSAELKFLTHIGWRQPGTGSFFTGAQRLYFDDAPPPLPGAAAAAQSPAPAALTDTATPATLPVFEGTVQLRVGRYLDVSVDLMLRDAVDTPIRLQETRRMRLGELHYLDHPLYGVLIEVLPYRLAGQPELTPPDELLADPEAAPLDDPELEVELPDDEALDSAPQD